MHLPHGFRLRLAGLLMGSLAAAMILAPVAAADTTTFPQQDSRQEFVVPAGVCSITMDVLGAQGGDAPGNGNFFPAGIGGNGAHVRATIPVTPGETLGVFTGGSGTNGVFAAFPTAATAGTGGFNGGADGGGASASSGGGASVSGAGGGGASDVRQIAGGTGCVPCVTPTPGTGVEARIIVAGGGGGGGGGNTNNAPGVSSRGGAGGGTSSSTPDGDGSNGTGGVGGTAAGQGGTTGGGGSGASGNGSGAGGGGGGGANGGNGGGGGGSVSGGGGGGAGSSAVTASGATDVTFAIGDNDGTGSVVFNYTVTGLPTCPATNPAQAISSEDINFTG